MEGVKKVMKQHKVLVPKRWVVGVFCIVGVYATGLIYNSVIDGGWVTGFIGATLLSISLYATASPLAASMWRHRVKKSDQSLQPKLNRMGTLSKKENPVKNRP